MFPLLSLSTLTSALRSSERYGLETVMIGNLEAGWMEAVYSRTFLIGVEEMGC